MIVIKRDGTKEDFDVNKIITAVNSAFTAVNEKLPQYLVNMINALMANKDLTVDQMHRLEALEDNKSQAAAIKQKMVNGNDWRE